MPKFAIAVRSSGVILGVYDAASEDDAADVMARDAGYQDYRDMCSITDPDDLDARVEQQRAGLDIKRIEG